MGMKRKIVDLDQFWLEHRLKILFRKFCMLNLRRPARACLVCLASLSLVSCLGGSHNGSARSVSSGFPLQVSPSSIRIPAGGGGFVTVSIGRRIGIPGQATLTIRLSGTPAGVSGSGAIAPNATSGLLALQVDASVPPQTLSNLQVVVSDGSVSGSQTFGLVIDPQLPPGAISPDGVQASGVAQSGGALSNTPVIQEPVAAKEASDSVPVVEVRHGYLPSASTH